MLSCCSCLRPVGGSSGLDFANTPSSAIGDFAIPQSRRIYFGIFFPEDCPGVRPLHMFFDRQKGTHLVLERACAAGGLKLDRGRIVGSPAKLNLFTVEGDMLRTDMDIEAHLGSTLHPSSVLLLEKGNRVREDRLELIRDAAVLSQNSGGCAVM